MPEKWSSKERRNKLLVILNMGVANNSSAPCLSRVEQLKLKQEFRVLTHIFNCLRVCVWGFSSLALVVV